MKRGFIEKAKKLVDLMKDELNLRDYSSMGRKLFMKYFLFIFGSDKRTIDMNIEALETIGFLEEEDGNVKLYIKEFLRLYNKTKNVMAKEED